MTDTIHLGLPFIEGSQAQKHVTHNEALRILDALVMLSVKDRDLSAPPLTPLEGDRYLVKATGTGEFAGKDDFLAHYADDGWTFYPPKIGWLCYVEDESVLLAWDGAAWTVASSGGGGSITELQNLALLGVGTTADTTNPLSAKLNNVLWAAKTIAEGGDGTLRYKLSKESADKTLSFLFQDDFSGHAEIGLTGDDDFHFKTSPDGSTWIDALLLDKTTGSAKINSGFFLTGDISPPQITSDQNDYNPSGLARASVLRLSADAARNVTGLSGGGAGRMVALVNVGASDIVLKDASTSSSAGNRFSLGSDVTLGAKQSAMLWYDATDTRWKLLAGPQAGGGGGAGADGADAGIRFTFSSATSGDPGAGKFLWNSASFGSASELSISETDGDGNSVAALLAAIDNGTSANKALVIFKQEGGSAYFFAWLTSALTDHGGYDSFAVTPIVSAGSMANGDACRLIVIPVGDKGDAGAAGSAGATGATGASGSSSLTICRAVATTNVDVSTALESGDSIDGVTLSAGDRVLLTGQSSAAENGVYTVSSSGAASRDTSFATYDSMPGVFFSVMEGAANHDTLWRCTSDRGGTIDATALSISQFSSGVGGGDSALSPATLLVAASL